MEENKEEQSTPLHRLYEYKGQKYWLLEEILSKDPVTRDWVPYYLYRLYPDGGGQKSFTRSKSEFLDRFTKVEYNKQL
jgi:hypothetical protein